MGTFHRQGDQSRQFVCFATLMSMWHNRLARWHEPCVFAPTELFRGEGLSSHLTVCCVLWNQDIFYLVFLVRKFFVCFMFYSPCYVLLCVCVLYVCLWIKNREIFPSVFEDTFDTFWICVARAAMAEQRSDGDAHSLLVRACRLIRAACMHIMLHANTNLSVGVGYFSRFWWSQTIASECAKISWVFVKWAGSRWGAVYFCWDVQLFWVQHDIYRMLGDLISWIFAQRDSRHV